jgi:hypothetical protein
MTDEHFDTSVEASCERWGDIPAWVVNEARRARASETALVRALARWGIIEWAETDANEQDTGRMLRRCRECGRRVFVAPTEVKHTKGCSIGRALSGFPIASSAPNLREALELLVAVQNGPPLLKYEREWNAAMEMAQRALASKRTETP